jgi:tRNA(His) guanylyltransferase
LSRKLAQRMKDRYENRSKSWLQRRSNTIIRVKTNKQMQVSEIDKVCLEFCKSVPGTQMCFGADREISVLLIDYWSKDSDLWFNGDVQKIVSKASSIASVATGLLFSSVCFSISDQVEVYNYFVWRQKVWITNQAQEKTRSAIGHDLTQGLSLSLENPDTGRLAMKLGRQWNMLSPPVFTLDSDFLTMLIPRYPKLDNLL